jgi:hypothetical protein
MFKSGVLRVLPLHVGHNIGLGFLSDWHNLPSKAPYLAADGVTLECDQSLDDSYAGYLYHSPVDDACAGLNYSSYDMVRGNVTLIVITGSYT